MTTETMGARLKASREYAGLSTGQVAYRLGIACFHVEDWEADRADPGEPNLERLSRIYDVARTRLREGFVEATEGETLAGVVCTRSLRKMTARDRDELVRFTAFLQNSRQGARG